MGSPVTANETLVGALRAHAHENPNGVAFEFVRPLMPASSVTYTALFAQSQCVAHYLRQHFSRGARILLPTNNDPTFYPAFLGCLMAACIAVPLQVPARKSDPRTKGNGRFASIVRGADPDLILVDASHEATLALALAEQLDAPIVPRLSSIQSVLAGAAPSETEANDLVDAVLPDAIAFLQYTSGSTSSPKGVAISNAAIMRNQQSIAECFALTTRDTYVSWLPLFHDMGLCNGLFMPLCMGRKCKVLTPLAFIARPRFWLEQFAGEDSVISAAPNFAYAHCSQRISDAELASVDLRGWRVAVCGAEPIRPSDVRAFCARFEPVGFRAQAFSPSYGLAEGTLFVSAKGARADFKLVEFDSKQLAANHVQAKVSGGVELVSCGAPSGEIEILVVSATTREPLPVDEVGEIAVSSASAGACYWSDPEATAAVFNHDLRGTGKGQFFLTGDLGFVHEGELFISGRHKELIILNGVNHYPQDIELCAQSQHQDLSLSRACAFESAAPAEGVVLVLEVPRKVSALLAQLRTKIVQAVRLEHQLLVSDVVFVPTGAVPKTSSGKMQRRYCMELYRTGHFTATRYGEQT